MNKKYAKWFWFIGGFAVGFTLISIGHAALPKKTIATPSARGQSLTELRAARVGAPELEQEFAKLSSLESRYAENADQQKKLKTATTRSTRKIRN